MHRNSTILLVTTYLRYACSGFQKTSVSKVLVWLWHRNITMYYFYVLWFYDHDYESGNTSGIMISTANNQ